MLAEILICRPGPSSVKVPSTPPPAPKEEWQMTPKTSNSVHCPFDFARSAIRYV